MHLADLEVLVCLAEEGNFSRAAEKLNRSQSAVSQAIRRLEEAFQAQLLDRNTRRAVLTGAGTSAVSTAQRMLQIWDGAVRGLSERTSGKQGVLRLAANGLLCDYLLPPLLGAFRERAPGVRIELIQSPATGIPTALLDQDFDFGFLSFAPANRGLACTTLFRDDLVLCVGPSHPLSRFESVTWNQVAAEPFLAHSHRTPSRKRLEFQMGQAGVRLKVAMELPSLEAIKRFVASGSGISILPRLCVEGELADGSLASPALRSEAIGRDIRVAHRKDRDVSRAGAAFLALLKERYA